MAGASSDFREGKATGVQLVRQLAPMIDARQGVMVLQSMFWCRRASVKQI